MVITDDLIYFELHKTGCSHTVGILSDLYAGQHQIIGKHNTYDQVSKKIIGNFQEKIKVGNIRNPWDWYVSLWSFGCQKKGGLYEKLAGAGDSVFSKRGIKKLFLKTVGLELPQLSKEVWKKLYSDPTNVQHFNAWLHLILNDKNHSLGEGYKDKSWSKFTGLLTYRYLKLFTYRGNQFKKIESKQHLVEYDKDENFMDFILRNETLHQDLELLGNKIGYDNYRLKEVLNKHTKRTNTSIREKDYRLYYTDSSRALVQERDSFIIDKYDYEF